MVFDVMVMVRELFITSHVSFSARSGGAEPCANVLPVNILAKSRSPANCRSLPGSSISGKVFSIGNFPQVVTEDCMCPVYRTVASSDVVLCSNSLSRMLDRCIFLHWKSAIWASSCTRRILSTSPSSSAQLDKAVNVNRGNPGEPQSLATRCQDIQQTTSGNELGVLT